MRFLRFSFTQRTQRRQRKRLRLNGNRASVAALPIGYSNLSCLFYTFTAAGNVYNVVMSRPSSNNIRNVVLSMCAVAQATCMKDSALRQDKMMLARWTTLAILVRISTKSGDDQCVVVTAERTTILLTCFAGKCVTDSSGTCSVCYYARLINRGVRISVRHL